MKTESQGFTREDIAGFVTDYLEHERASLIARLRQVLDEVDALIGQVSKGADASDDSWNPVEVLAHMATSSQYFGWLAHKVATKQDIGDVLPMIQMRDNVTADAAQLGAAALTEQLRQSVERTIGFLERTDPMNLRTTFDYVGIQMTAEDVIRIPLCSHLESHVQQMSQTLN